MKEKNKLDRRKVAQKLLKGRKDILVITGLGGTCWDITSAGDNDLNFPMWGGMGGASMVGLGLAIAQPDKTVLVVTGDGEMLMGLGSLATIAAADPENLSIIVFDNEHFGETGMQKTHTAKGTDLVKVAEAVGFRNVSVIENQESLESFDIKTHSQNGPMFCVIKISNNNPTPVLPPRDGAYLKDRFRQALLGKKSAI